MNYFFIRPCLWSAALLAAAVNLARATMPYDAEIEAALRECVDNRRLAPGIAVAVVEPEGTRIFTRGKARAGGPDVDGATVFEIGSITKVFTSLLLQEAVDRGVMKLDDPVAKYLPASVKVPSRNGREITLVDLVTHTSGLPRLPGNLKPADPANPYADYTVEQLYKFLSGYSLTRDIGAEYEYSNLGMGLLGHALALQAGTTYEQLVLQKICQPLKMSETSITLSPELRARFATPHNKSGVPVKAWDFRTLEGCGALHSTVTDLAKFLGAQMGVPNTPLLGAMRRSHTPLVSAGGPQMVGLAWHIDTRTNLTWHNGGTYGFHSYIGFNSPQTRGVVVLANSESAIENLGGYILGAIPKLPVAEKSQPRQVSKVDPAIYDRYAGWYEFRPGLDFRITRVGDRLLAQLTGQASNEVFPESETKFFYKVVDAQLTFVRNEAGEVTHLILHQNGLDQKAMKVK
ncbi:MAG TPA: serine hydrolase [Verrucomicrobiae bacterium]|nr:serine hydrolase [Verrucomicrobiae bacterium]